MGARSVLIFSVDPFAAALLGGAVEVAAYTPHFARDDESPRDALLRIRPAIAIVDCDHELACAESFLGPALMAGTSVIIFSSSRSNRRLAPIAEHFNVRTVELPIDVAALAVVLREVQPSLST